MRIDYSKDKKIGAITFMDILGWKGIWQRSTSAMNDIHFLIRESIKRARKLAQITAIQNQVFNLETAPMIVDVKSISDTIVLMTYGDCDNALKFHGLISALLIRDSIIKGIPVRGATCYGEFMLNGNVMVGPAIDEVASWYEACDWIGVILTPSALFQSKYFFEKFSTDKQNFKDIYIKSSIPIKQNGPIEALCVNWVDEWCRGNRSHQDLAEIFLGMQPLFPDVTKKLMNTLKFYNHVNGLRDSG